MLLGAGRTLAVIDLQADGLVGRIGGVAVKVAVDKTDLWVRVGERRMPEAAAAAPAAAGKTESTVTTSPEGNGAASAASASTRRVPPAMQRLLADKLVRLEGGRVKSAGAAAVEGVRFFALYYSASWCGPCRQFTPDLIRAYRELKAKHPEFEVVFVSADRSAGEMADYMKGDKMPWLAVGYEKRDHKIMSYSGPGIPCLVLVDEQGRVLSDSYEGDNYVGPQKVLADTRRRLARND
jgi:nucleoredoxin